VAAAGGFGQGTDSEVKKVEPMLANDPELKGRISHYAAYVGMGSVRFFLPLDPQMPNDNFAQFVLMTRGLADSRGGEGAPGTASGPGIHGPARRVLRLENGPPVGFPVQFRVSGSDPETLRAIAGEVAQVMRAHPYAKDVHLDWNERVKQVRLNVDQDKGARLGLSSQELSLLVNNLLTATPSPSPRGRSVDRRDGQGGRRRPPPPVATRRPSGAYRDGHFVPLSQIATLTPELEEGLIWRRDRLPTITVRCDLREGIQAQTVTAAVDPKLDALRAKLPPATASTSAARRKNRRTRKVPSVPSCRWP